jgi:hypothetical protein
MNDLAWAAVNVTGSAAGPRGRFGTKADQRFSFRTRALRPAPPRLLTQID